MIERITAEVKDENRIEVRMPRHSGKTQVALNWARKQSKQEAVLFVVSNEDELEETKEMIYNMFDDIEKEESNIISFEDGGQILLSTTKKESMCRTKAIVLDGVDKMNFSEVINSLARVARGVDFSFCMTYTKVNPDVKTILKSMDRAEKVAKISVDYLDLIESGDMTPEGVRGLISLMGARKFREEYGPFDKLTCSSIHPSFALV